MKKDADKGFSVVNVIENHDIDSLKYDENPYNEEEKREPQKILLGMKNKKQKSHLKINLVKPQLI